MSGLIKCVGQYNQVAAMGDMQWHSELHWGWGDFQLAVSANTGVQVKNGVDSIQSPEPLFL